MRTKGMTIVLGIVLAVLVVSDARQARADTIVFRYGDTNAFVDGYAGVTDTMLLADTRKTFNYGGTDDIHIGLNTWGAGNNTAHSLLRWDLQSISGWYRSIQSVTLELTVQVVNDDAANALQVYQVAATNKDWVAGTGTNNAAQGGSSSWDYKHHDTNTWAGSEGCSTAGTDYESQLLGSTNWSTLSPGDTVSVSFTNLTASQLMALIDQWSGNQADNAGLFLRAQNESSGWFEFNSSQCATLADRPRLTIEYTPVRSGRVVFQQGATNVFVDGYTGMEDNMLLGRSGRTGWNYGAYDRLYVGATGWGGVVGPGRGIMRWDLSSMHGQYRSILALTLRFHSKKATSSRMWVYAVKPANSAWEPGTNEGATQSGKSCWDYRAYNTTDWAGTNGCGEAGVDFDAEPLADMTWGTSSTGTIDIALNATHDELTALVDTWAGNQADNAGLFMRARDGDESKGQFDGIEFRSSDYSTLAERPQLIIDYRLPPAGTVIAIK